MAAKKHKGSIIGATFDWVIVRVKGVEFVVPRDRLISVGKDLFADSYRVSTGWSCRAPRSKHPSKVVMVPERVLRKIKRRSARR